MFTTIASAQGQWSALENWPTRAVHTTLLPDGRVFFVSYYNESLQPNIWDPVTNTFSPTAASSYALFCAGHTNMADGRVFIAGGHIADYTGYAHAEIYSPSDNKFTQVPDMNQGRWYPSTTVLPSGDILVVSGDVNSNTVVDPLPQVFQVANGSWRNLSSAQLMQALYPVMLVAPNGKVFYAGPEPLTRYLDPSGAGAWSSVATHKFSGWRDYGPGLMYDVGKVLEVGGGDPATATAEVIDLTAASPAWNFTGSMHYARRQQNAVILPDAKVLIVGGSSGSGFDDSTNPVLATEMWDPATGQFTLMASIAVYRGYHSTALLLPDGRVLSAGGNVGGPNAQVFSPPYLSAGTRPSISSSSVPTSVGYGETAFIGTPDAATIAQVTWLRTGSTTHTFDESQRFMRLNFTQANGGLNVTFPANGNLAPPGYYMLFLLNTSGVPSVAKIIQITQGGGTTGILTGTVTSNFGAPLAAAQVTSGTVSATTAPDGIYTLAGINAGSATVTASLAGYQNASQVVTVTAGNSTSVPVIQLVPTNPGAITGSVVDSSGTAIAGVSLTAAGLTVTTGSNGVYSLSNVPAGTVSLTASAASLQPASENIVVTAGRTTTAPTMTLKSDLGNVTGKVINSSNTPIAGASVSFGGGSATTDSTGTYNFTNIPAGSVQLVASASGYQSVTQNVTVTGGTTTTANFSLAAGTASPGTVTGKVTNISNGNLISSATVKWNGTSVTSNSSGVFTIVNVAGGSQTITASATGYLPLSSTVNVSGGTSTLNFRLSTAGVLNVKVVSASGAALSGATVNLSGGGIATSLTGTTNSSGLYSSNWIPIGNYSVSTGAVSETATVSTGQTTTITLTQQNGGTGTIAGSVTNSTGTVLSGATVSSGGISTTTQSNGAYTLSNVAAGTETATASMAGYQTATKTATVSAGTTATLDFSLVASISSPGVVTGKVTNISNGAALSGATVKWNTIAVSTNASGVYTLNGVSGGTQTLTASVTGYLARSSTVTVTGGTSSTLNFQLATAGIIKVTAKNSAGAADTGATVSIQGGVIATKVSGLTNSTGVYSTNWIPVGSYTVTISESGRTTQSKSLTLSSGQTAAVNFTF